MKKAFIATAAMVGIIAVRILLSIALSDQAAEIFCRVSVSFLILYYICSISHFRMGIFHKVEK